jgi:hypothetical protein
MIIIHHQDLNFTVVATPGTRLVEFAVYDIVSWGRGGVPLWLRRGSTACCDATSELSKAGVYLHGEVKWDGCSNWHFDEQDRVMIHGCSREDLERLGQILTFCWDQASELCPGWAP